MLHLNDSSKFKYSSKKFDYNKVYMPTVGMLGTEYVGSDRYAVFCFSVDSPKRVTVAMCSNIDENTDLKNYENIYIDDEGVMYLKDVYKEKCYDVKQYSLRKNGQWKQVGEGNHTSSIHWGIASPYRDMDF